MKLSTFRVTKHRGALLLGAGGLLAATVGAVPANAAVTFTSATFSGSASGEALHVDLLGNAASVDVARSSSAVNSKGISAAATDEALHHPINPALPAKNAYAYAKGLDAAGIAIADEAVSSAPPNAPAVQAEVAVPVSPLVYASLSRGNAMSKWNADSCVLGDDIARGYGYVADAQVLETGTSNPDGSFQNPLVAADTGPNTRDVVQSISRQTLVPNADGTFGLRSQVATTLVPVTLFKGTPTELTIVGAGDWLLTGVATGIPGKSTVTVTPPGDSNSPSTPLLRIIQGGLPDTILTLQDLLGDAGLTIPIPGVADIGLADNLTQTIAADGTSVSASMDIVRVVLVDGAVANIRLGHSAIRAQVPAGGIDCPIPVSKKATPNIVNSTTAPDGKFQVAITIKNGFDCPLINISAVDLITRKSGDVVFSIVEDDARNDPKKGAGATFTRNSSTSATATYANLGNLAPGASKVLNVVIQVGSGSGEIQDVATAKGTLACTEGSAIGQANINMSGSFTLVTTVARVLARTGGTAGIALALAGTAMAAILTRRVARARRIGA